ncbi:hypermethylated in cancer 1 protein-like [Acipenser oxyrinchus oxyrinchus]|uniref:Hypermethylated in cancer 1 protein-like n=1 Tax=Acipenser oxyrinchus oxyrinchus TaxID=40147 RepID=A0AAD8CXA8_ACIOX|nr:hypermethylated in cancer 1 protein-like [Acipenser oxyrinchus oxyrinchus]
MRLQNTSEMIIQPDLKRMAEETGHPGGGLTTMLDAMEVPSHARHLLLQLNNQRTKGFLCDVIIVVQNALFRAHKNVLAASSIYLKSLVVHDNLINLDHEMVSPGIFRIILDYIYTGRLNEGDQATEQNLGAVLAAASYLQLLDLVALCKKKQKRNGKYGHFRSATFSLYGKMTRGGGGVRTSTPVIQSCFSGAGDPPRNPLKMPPVEAVLPHPLTTHTGELYAPSSQGNHVYQHQQGIRLSERDCSPMYGLDLTKKSPSSQSQPSSHHHHHHHHHQDGGHENRVDPQQLGPGRESPLPTLLDTNGGHYTSKEQSHHFHNGMETDDHPLSQLAHPHPSSSLTPQPHSHNQEPLGGAPSPGSDLHGQPEPGQEVPERGGGVYRWMKHEQLSGYPEDEEDCEREKDPQNAIGGSEDKKSEGSLLSQHALAGGRYPASLGCDAEDDKSGTSEETGSSDGPSPPGNADRFHLAYEPESFGDNLYVCIPCGKGFPSSEQLNAHVEAHTEEELYSKDSGGELGGVGANNSLAGGYLDKPSPGLPGEMIRPYRCASCEKSYKDPATLRQHEKTHWLTRPYPCSICGKKFTQRGTMTRHMRSHLGLKPFACDSCGMRFTRQYRLTEHMRIHSGEKPYECQVCGGKFAQQRNLISHMKMHSAGGGGVGLDGKTKVEFMEGIYPLSKYADPLGLKQERASEILVHASQHLLADSKAMESLYPLSKFAASHLGLGHEKASEVLSQASHLSGGELRAIDRFSPS